MSLEFNENQPLYQQLAEYLKQAILAGYWREGEAIPSVRRISVEQGLNPQTVLNATQLLVQEGILEKRRGLGLFVANGARERLQQKQREELARKRLPALAREARLLGFSLDELWRLFKEAYKASEKDEGLSP